jgi:hypothetical protein
MVATDNVLIESIPLCSKLSVYLHNPSNTTKDDVFSLVVLDGLCKYTDN